MIELISLFVIMFIIFIVLFWLRKTLFLLGFFFKVFLLFIFVIIIGSFVFGYMVIKDANDFKNNFGNSTSMVIVKESENGTDRFLSGVTMNPQDKDFKTMTKRELGDVEDLYKAGKLDTLGPEYYKVFIIELRSFDDVALDNITDNNVQLSKEEIKTIMLSDNAREDLAIIVAAKSGDDVNDVYNRLGASDEEVKSYILTYYLSTIFSGDNITDFMKQLKKDNIKVYANTALFKAVKLVPTTLINSFVDKEAKNMSSQVKDNYTK